jgi:hypothetical protein
MTLEVALVLVNALLMQLALAACQARPMPGRKMVTPIWHDARAAVEV